MKFILLCVSVAILDGALTTSLGTPRGVARGPSDSLRKMLENLRKQMPCGFPEYGLPPLAPLKLDYQEFNIDEEFASGFVHLFDLRVDGLNEFDIIDVSFNVLTLKSTFDINFKEISSIGQYEMDVEVPEMLTLSGKGDLDLKLQNLKFKGHLKLAARLSGVQLKEFNIVVSLGGVKSNISGLAGGGVANEFLNKVIERLLVDIVKEQEKFISKTIYDAVVPMANKELSKYSLTDIIRMITKPSEPRECIPPPDVKSLIEEFLFDI